MDRQGFSLLETLFAIVVMAIIITPIPALFTTISDSAKAIQSKDILSSTLSETMKSSTFRWDEHSQGGGKNANRILDTNSTNFKRSNSLETNLTNYIVRNYFKNREYYRDELNIPIPPRKFFQLKDVDFNRSRIYSTLPKDFKEVDEINRGYFDDIDDWNGIVLDFKDVQNMKVDFKITYKISYIDDNILSSLDNNSSKVSVKINRLNTLNNQTSNLKLIELVGEENSSIQNYSQFSLHYIATNIGEPILFFKDLNSSTLCTNQNIPCFCYLEAIDDNFTQAKCP